MKRLWFLKVFDKEEYADKFIEKGEMKFTSSNKFREYPDEFYRRDHNEGLIREKVKIPKEYADSKITMKGMYGREFVIDSILKAVKDVREKECGEEVTITQYGDIEATIDYYTKTFIYSVFLVDSNFIASQKLFDSLRSLGNFCVLVAGDIILEELSKYMEDKVVYLNHGKIKYVDEEYLNKNRMNSFIKHDKYKDQNEYRITMLPKEDYEGLDYVFVALGNIIKIAQKTTVDKFIEILDTASKQVVKDLRETTKFI